MAAKQLIMPGNIAFNSRGLAVPSAVASLYETGTLTPALFYADAGLTVALGSSITADGIGRFPIAYQDETVAFRLRITDEFGALLPGGDVDPYYFGGIGTADQTLRGDLAATSGGGLIGWLASWTGAVARTIADKLTDTVSVKDFGAKGDSVVTKDAAGNITGLTSGTDDTAAFVAAIAYVNSKGGGGLFVPIGNYKITSYLTLCKGLRLYGASRKGSNIIQTAAGGGGATNGENVRNGTALYSNWPSNSSTQANVRVEHLGICCTNGSNVGAGFYDNCGAYIYIRDCVFSGFKYGVVFDQTECSDVSECDFEFVRAGGACVYLVNGDSLTPSNLQVVTNRISVSKCQFNPAGAANYCVFDEGGYTHRYEANNYNGGLNHIYIAGAQAFEIIGGEFEASVGANIVLEFHRMDGGGVGGCLGRIQGILAVNSTNPIISIVSTSGPILIAGNWMSRSDGNPPISGANGANELVLSGNYTSSTSFELTDGQGAYGYRDSGIDRAIWTNSSLSAFNLDRNHANKITLCTSVTANAGTIRQDSTGGAAVTRIGTTFCLEQTTATGPASLVAGTGVTLVGPTATTAQYQRLCARKVAANTWRSWLELPNPLQPSVQQLASAATITPTTGNDQVHVTALAVAATIANPTGTPFPGQRLIVRIKDNGTARALTWGAGYRGLAAALPTTTVLGKLMYVTAFWNGTDALWDITSVVQQA